MRAYKTAFLSAMLHGVCVHVCSSTPEAINSQVKINLNNWYNFPLYLLTIAKCMVSACQRRQK